ncbi:squalene/phytoene synthase family protein [Sphingomonas sp. NFR15]|uniref:squalene/phytoene synthase family protein n=1 Tax=Sphingomonas sp. NFR15 TaxID=1566282 RepID=UPI00088AE65B|nr:squalene/phytoene synthase family protein [Sphingomonas sp. NFR15]SDA11953.1 phytoene synthase [Sphingomonas sp. NFR15]
MQADPESALALDYAPAEIRPALHALFALDDTFGQVLRTTTEPMIGQMRLAWWHDALRRLDEAAPPAQPVLQDLAEAVLPRGVSGAALAELVTGWEALIEAETIDEAVMRAHAEARGGGVFAAAAALLGRSDARVAAAGRGWALADLSRHLRAAGAAGQARAMAEAALAEALSGAWPARLRPLGALALVARMNLAVPADAPIPAGAPRRVARLMVHRMTGR